ncbi:short-chain dehydrogenase/reductase [Aliidongia dinghuensis]|uniref:Short-chain dehydrogenase/reductase n=1 Tax=Aliidongia dinghuensis TaxID=1867774 RepID=A0A8J2YNT6_9PROT|nr:oxidoreductase [Aliidongia dinghuensis]GGE99842.1 short-chain dehydrogenase/reductase [Aliidongia dinghuensis]
MSKTVLVTGASAGIGAATVRRLLAAGHTVYAGARRVDRMKPLETAGARLLALDVTDDASMVAAIDEIVRDAGRLDGLVNNAGYGSYGALEDVPIAEGRRQVEVNLIGLARLIQLATPIMRRQGSGRIINITSIGGKMWEPLGAWYHATKFAVEGLSDCLRMELAPFGIDVVVVEPGGIRTEWSGIARENLLKTSGATAYRDQAERHARLLAGTETSRMVSEADVVATTILKGLTVARPKTRYATGGGANTILTLRRILTDRQFDGFMRMIIRRLST